MPGQLRNVVLGAVAATVLAGCGSDDGTIPPDNADLLIERLDAIESNVNEQDCTDAQDQAEAFKGDVNELPAPVDDEVKQGLQQLADQLINLTSDDCQVETGATDGGGVVPTDTTETEPPTTETTETTPPEETQTPEETEPTEPQEDQDLAPDDDEGRGGGSVGSDGGVGPSGGVGSGGDG